MKTVKLQILDVIVNRDGSGVIITKVSADNPSSNGVFFQRKGQIDRLVSRAGLVDAIELKQLCALPEPSFISMECIECKAGDSWTNEATGATGTYTKDHTQTSNEEIVLSQMAIAKGLEVSAQVAVNVRTARALGNYAAPAVSAPIAAPAPATAEAGGDDSPSGEEETPEV